jgi:hypothetical protein
LEETPPADSESSEPSSPLNLEALHTGITGVVARINRELGTSFSGNNLTLNSSIFDQDDANLLAQVSFQGTGFSGNVTALFRSYDFGWRQGWQLTHFRDFVLYFNPPITLPITTETGNIRRTLSGARVGGNALEVIPALASASIQYQ